MKDESKVWASIDRGSVPISQSEPDLETRYQSLEIQSVWTFFGHFNLLLMMIWLPYVGFFTFFASAWESKPFPDAIPWADMVLLVQVFLICCGIEFLRRLHVCRWATSHVLRCLSDTLRLNLAGVLIILTIFAYGLFKVIYFLAALAVLSAAMNQRNRRLRAGQPLSTSWSRIPALRPRRLLPYQLILCVWVGLWIFSLTGVRGGYADRAGISNVKANQHTFQTMVETYALRHAGVYSPDLVSLKTDAKAHEYWKEMYNPFQSHHLCRYFLGQACSVIDYTSYQAHKQGGFKRETRLDDWLGLTMDSEFGKPVTRYWMGQVLYDYVSPTRYYIYGTDRQGMLIRDKGQDFVLSNS